MLIRNAEVAPGLRIDVRISADRIVEMGKLTPNQCSELEVDACGGTLLPGLHDHHLHFLAYAASLNSVQCGPPSIQDADGLVKALQTHRAPAPDSWIRGVGYHRSVAGEIDRDWLDGVVPNAPVRVQERSGRLWIFNSAALDRLVPAGMDTPLETVDGRYTGRLYDGDSWLRERLGKSAPPVRLASERLLSRGVTGFTDTTPTNGRAEDIFFRNAKAAGEIAQSVFLMGNDQLDGLSACRGVSIGPRKIHLHETDLPDLSEMSAAIAATHALERRVAIHCVTIVELVFALAAFEEAGTIPGDRIEHAAIAPPELVQTIARLGLTIVTQPNFIAERGDAYLRDVEPLDRPWLYRLQGFLQAGVRLAGGTDAPFGDADPWKAMYAAGARRTRGGAILGSNEALAPGEALALFLGELNDPGGPSRAVRVGAPADLCLIDRSWRDAWSDFSDVAVAITIKDGRIAWSG